MNPSLHDLLVSRSSHLPHVIAAALASMVLDPAGPRQQAKLCATGFRDTTRVASGSPEMWRDIALTNGRNIEAALGRFIRELERLRGGLKRGDVRAISEFFERAKRRRDRWCAKMASPSPE